jgi:hypothetical protein
MLICWFLLTQQSGLLLKIIRCYYVTFFQPHLQKGLERRIHSSRSDVFMNRQDESESHLNYYYCYYNNYYYYYYFYCYYCYYYYYIGEREKVPIIIIFIFIYL